MPKLRRAIITPSNVKNIQSSPIFATIVSLALTIEPVKFKTVNSHPFFNVLPAKHGPHKTLEEPLLVLFKISFSYG